MTHQDDPDLSDEVDRAADLLARARRVTVLTGAGVSTDSGIPDFRGPQGVWTRDPAAERLATLQAYVEDPEVRREAWRQRAVHPVWEARPGPAHTALVDLERTGRLHALLTQNIDELHQTAGSSPDLVVELHGTMHHTQCLSCGARAPMAETLARVAAGEDDPPCPHCGGILKSATISFGENLDAGVLMRARQAAIDTDVLLAVGTSLGVHPAAGVVDLAAAAGASVVIVNGAETPYDDVADVVLRGGISELLPRLVAGL
ncbi:NAD-dependent protein deacetylase 2 [Actinomycetospora sp. NBRC 106375]|uniref:SIR2 family NAD-dependent protein deacylase n=1 Tax=Actinomycetospora sp. NBRC 106375 TaxID=3032207 RepID=UPI00249FC5A3|nr:Sir2 family NAD-dependent protein deacetylase [Actinomycetospora sp. NBRC 106375]GLZ48213.1 NAD-dependent protein deacetylase 2 [Actinomycetospora sp. NBRC 106375]